MPVYNVERYIKVSIESVLNQTFKNFELILVDDGSPDNCPKICDNYADIDSRIKVIHKVNGGLSSARNAGLSIAAGQYIQFLDSDDKLETNCLEELARITSTYNSDVIIFGVNIYCSDYEKPVKNCISQPLSFTSQQDVRNNYSLLAYKGLWNYAWDKLYKKEIILDNRIKFNSNYDKVCEDTVFLVDLFLHVKSIYVSEMILHNYYIRENQSVVKKFIPDRFEKYYGRFVKTKELINLLPPKEENLLLMYNFYIQIILWAYELLFHKQCNYNKISRYFYIKNTFSIDNEETSFRENALMYFKKNKSNFSVSGAASIALYAIVRKHYFIAWIVHILSLFKLYIKKIIIRKIKMRGITNV